MSRKRVAITITDDKGNTTLFGSKIVETGPNGEFTIPIADLLKQKKELPLKLQSLNLK